MILDLVEIYTKTQCSFCDTAKSILKNNNIGYTEYRLDEDFTREEILNKYPFAKTYPVVVINGVHVGGAQELATLVEARKSNGSQHLLNEENNV